MLYEGASALVFGAPVDRRLLLAHSATLRTADSWVRYIDSAHTAPLDGDERIASHILHSGHTAPETNSFVSVPTIGWDGALSLWRTWFVTDENEGVGIRSAESANDGQSWDADTASSDAPIDCADSGGTPDDDLCSPLAYDTATPDDPAWGTAADVPDIVDPEFVTWYDPIPGAPHTGMMFTGVDGGCGDTWGAQLWQEHAAFGWDDAGSWTWSTDVAADPTDGVVTAYDRAGCTGVEVMDPEVIWVSTSRYLIFWNVQTAGGSSIYWGASGYACSDFVDNDGDGKTDFSGDSSADTTCTLPTGITE